MFNVTGGEGQIDYNVMLHGLAAVTDVQLGCAKPGTNGPTVASLFHSASPVGTMTFTGTLTQSDILAAAVACNPNIHTLSHLVQAMREGSIYINILTSAFPAGEIRGQLHDAPTQVGSSGSSSGSGSPTGTPMITPSSQTVTSSQHIDFNGRNFGHEETVTIKINGVLLGSTAHADGGGNFTTGSITMPTTPGTYVFTFTGTMSGITQTSTITVM